MSNEFIWSLDTQTKASCKGLFFRCHAKYHAVSINGSFAYVLRFVPEESMSCEGCEHCGFLVDSLREQDGEFNFEEAEDGALYALAVTDSSLDYETGCWDDWTVGFVRCDAAL